MKVMKAAGCTWDQMPIIPKYLSPKKHNTLCYSWAMESCGAVQQCQRVHAPKEDITDDFALSVIQLTRRGFEYPTSIYDSGGGTKRKAGGR